MGSFSFNCAVTRTEVGAGDEVLTVFIKPSVWFKNGINTYDLSQYLWMCRRLGEYNHESEIYHIGIEEYDTYGNLPDGFDDLVRDIGSGDWWEYNVTIHKSVCDGILGRPLNENNLTVDFTDIVSFCYKARIELYSNLLGQQLMELDELAAQELVYSETRRMLKIKHQQMIQTMIDLEDLQYLDNEICQNIFYILKTFPNVNNVSDIKRAVKLVSDNYDYDINHFLWKMVDDGILSFKSTGKQFEVIEK